MEKLKELTHEYQTLRTKIEGMKSDLLNLEKGVKEELIVNNYSGALTINWVAVRNIIKNS